MRCSRAGVSVHILFIFLLYCHCVFRQQQGRIAVGSCCLARDAAQSISQGTRHETVARQRGREEDGRVHAMSSWPGFAQAYDKVNLKTRAEGKQ